MPKIVDHEARRREISATAASLIAKGGLEAATIREIAQSSGYSKGVVEHYFENKQELLDGALNWANWRYEQRVDRATRNLSGIDALRKRVAATLPMDRAVRDEWKVRLVFWGMAAIHSHLRGRQEKRFQSAVSYYQSDIDAAIEHGDIARDIDSRVLARRLVNMTTGISTAALHNRSLYTKAFLQGEIDYLMDFIQRGSENYRSGPPSSSRPRVSSRRR